MDCSECIFKIMDDLPPMSGGPHGGKQVGCQANRLDLFILKGKAELPSNDSCYTLTQFCNMYRDEKWPGAEEDDKLNIARRQVASTFGIALFDDGQEDLSTIETTLHSILRAAQHYETAINYDHKRKLKVSVSFHMARPISQTLHIINKFNELGLNIRGTTAESWVQENERRLETVMFQQLVLGQFFIKLNQGDIVPEEFLTKIDNTINNQCQKVALFESEGISAIYNAVAREHYIDHKNIDDLISALKASPQSKGWCLTV